jgi:hypothetical protein
MRVAQKALLKIINLCAKIILFDKILDNKIDIWFNGLTIHHIEAKRARNDELFWLQAIL